MFGQSVTKAIIILGVKAADGSVESGAGGECHPCVGVIVLTLSVNVTKLSSLVTGHHLDSHLPRPTMQWCSVIESLLLYP